MPGSGLTYSYRTDGSGDSSNNTGFFFLFKQGTLQTQEFNVDTAITNYVKSFDYQNNVNKFDQTRYEKSLKNTLVDKISNEIIRDLLSIK